MAGAEMTERKEEKEEKRKKDGRQVKKKIITEELIEGEEAEAYPTSPPAEMEESREPAEPELIGKLPKPVYDVLFGMSDDAGPRYSHWSIGLDRWGPRNWRRYILKTGKLRQYDTLASIQEITNQTEDEHGGGTYFARILEAGIIRERIKIEIEGPPKLTAEDMKVTKETLEGVITDDDAPDDEAAQYKQQKKALEAKMELKKTEAEYKQLLKEVEPGEGGDEEGEDEPLFPPGVQMPPGMPYGGYQSPQDMKARIEREIEQKYEKKLERILDNMKRENQIEMLRAEIRQLKEAPPKKDNTDMILAAIKTIAEKFNPFDMAIRLAEAVKPVQAPQNEDQKMIAFANMLTGQMQSINQLTMSSFQQLMSTQGELTKQMIENAMAPPGERNWKLELVEKGMETAKSFASDLIDFNRSKQEITKKELDLVAQGKIQRMPLPAAAPRPAPALAAAPKPAPAPVSAPAPQPQPPQVQSGVPPQQVVEIYQKANNLMNEAIAAFLSGQSPKFFARKTLEIGGQDVTMFLMENRGIETLRELAAQQSRLEEFDKWVTNNPPAREWVETWLKEIMRNYRPVSTSPVREVHEELPESREPEFSGYYDNVPSGAEAVEMKFVPIAPEPKTAPVQEKSEKKVKNMEVAGERPVQAKSGKAVKPQPVVNAGVAADATKEESEKPESAKDAGSRASGG